MNAREYQNQAMRTNDGERLFCEQGREKKSREERETWK